MYGVDGGGGCDIFYLDSVSAAFRIEDGGCGIWRGFGGDLEGIWRGFDWIAGVLVGGIVRIGVGFGKGLVRVW